MTERPKRKPIAIRRAEAEAQRREAAESFLDDLPDQVRSLRRLVLMMLTNQMAHIGALQFLLRDHPEAVEILERSYQRTDELVTEELRI